MGLETKKYSLEMDAANTFQDYEKQLEDEIGKKKRGKRGSSTKVMDLVEIELQPPDWDDSPSVQDSKDFQITTTKESAIKDLSHNTLIKKWGQELLAVGAAAAWGLEERVLKIPVNRYIIKKEIHFGVDCNEVADTGWHVELGFNYTYVSDWQLARMIVTGKQVF